MTWKALNKAGPQFQLPDFITTNCIGPVFGGPFSSERHNTFNVLLISSLVPRKNQSSIEEGGPIMPAVTTRLVATLTCNKRVPLHKRNSMRCDAECNAQQHRSRINCEDQDRRLAFILFVCRLGTSQIMKKAELFSFLVRCPAHRNGASTGRPRRPYICMPMSALRGCCPPLFTEPPEIPVQTRRITRGT
jgi:hypothetical protein